MLIWRRNRRDDGAVDCRTGGGGEVGAIIERSGVRIIIGAQTGNTGSLGGSSQHKSLPEAGTGGNTVVPEAREATGATQWVIAVPELAKPMERCSVTEVVFWDAKSSR
jgi:hypothetical protein